MPAPDQDSRQTPTPTGARQDDAQGYDQAAKGVTLPDLSGMTKENWLSAIDDLVDEYGDYAPLGPKHHKLFFDLGRTLLVTFETIEDAQSHKGGLPRCVDMAIERDWSLLTFLSDGETWFRDRAIWGTLDRLTDDGFFDDFDRVLFLGAGSGGYAAATLSVAAPGARVLAIRPQATLTPKIAGWDRRFPHARKIDFTSRYGYGPDMIDAAEHVDLLVDPHVPLDAIHASLYTRANVIVHPMIHAGARMEVTLDRLGLMPELISNAIEGTLSPATVGRLWRKRRNHPAYLRLLLRKLEEAKRISLARRVCRFGLTTRERAFFAAKLKALDAKSQ